ncbi:hypothetical protein VCHA29O37_30010 [Vibrio chagasii]|nr:hypothetical protein VCHA29O37_30010 [Vibrio chagasii]
MQIKSFKNKILQKTKIDNGDKMATYFELSDRNQVNNMVFLV